MHCSFHFWNGWQHTQKCKLLGITTKNFLVFDDLDTKNSFSSKTNVIFGISTKTESNDIYFIRNNFSSEFHLRETTDEIYQEKNWRGVGLKFWWKIVSNEIYVIRLSFWCWFRIWHSFCLRMSFWCLNRRIRGNF